MKDTLAAFLYFEDSQNHAWPWAVVKTEFDLFYSRGRFRRDLLLFIENRLGL